jgi:hypothetical protein
MSTRWAHPSHHVEVGLNQIFPALARMDIFLLDLQCLANGKQLLGPKHSTILCDEALCHAKLLHSSIFAMCNPALAAGYWYFLYYRDNLGSEQVERLQVVDVRHAEDGLVDAH